MTCTQRQLEQSRRYRTNHPDRAKESTKRWRKKNMAHVLEVQRRWRADNIVRSLFTEAKNRAKARGVEFSIRLEDIPAMGERCPLLGHSFALPNTGSPFSPSLDRIDPKQGYVPMNVWIVGRRANIVKNDGTAEEHEMIARAMRAVAGAQA